jgi:glucose-1-phosphate thymidylyltransferase
MTEPERVGVVPAAGRGTRLGSLPFSKEIFPVAWAVDGAGSPRPRVAAEWLLRGFRSAGARRAYVVLRDGKWDIPGCLGDGERFGLSLAYLLMRWPHGQPFTLDAAYPFLGEGTVLFGFPDILFRPEGALAALARRVEEGGADVALGLFPAHRPWKMDMVETDEAGRVRRIDVKPRETSLTRTWILAAWAPSFTRFLHVFVEERLRESQAGMSLEGSVDGAELYLGHVFQAAMEAGLVVEGIPFPEGDYIDIGTPDELRQVLRGDFFGVEDDPAGPGWEGRAG